MNIETALLMGNEAIAFGALRAGVTVAAGYPGTPSTEILETIARNAGPDVYVEWSVNEKAALEVAAGAAYAGARALATMKQVGLNVASDPLMSLNYVGIKGGLVIVVADDPGPISSQTEQDTRRFGQFAKLAVFDPSSPEEAYDMVADAFDLSERTGRPVLLRPTTRVCHGYASITRKSDLPCKAPEGFTKDGGRFVIFPRLAYANHLRIEEQLDALSSDFSDYEYNNISGSGRKGIAAGGVSFAYAKEALSGMNAEHRLLKVSTVPFPDKLALEFLRSVDEVLVIEELDPVIEDALVRLCGLHNLSVQIKGKRTGDMPRAGENSVRGVREALGAYLGEPAVNRILPEPPPLPVRPPVLCAGCPHRASFFAVKEAVKGRRAVFCGDIGCYTLGNAQPLDMVDTCLCMGAGITVAQGLHRVEPDVSHFAFIGDSTFFHSGITGVINAVYNQTDVIICVLDNSTTAMTGNQPHPGIGRTATGAPAPRVDIYGMLVAAGVAQIRRVNAFDFPIVKQTVQEIMDMSGVRAILFEGPCIAIDPGKATYSVDVDLCTGCGACVRRLGCPALTMEDKRARVDTTLCTGCGLCANVCAFGALKGGDGAC